MRPALLTAVALFTGAGAWLLFQQGEGSLVYFACAAAGPPLGVGLGAALVAVCAGAGALGWRVAHAGGTPTQQFLGWIGLGASAIFGLAGLVMTAAIWLVPACAR